MNEAERNRLAVEAKFEEKERENKKRQTKTNKKPNRNKIKKGAAAAARSSSTSRGETINVNMASPIKNKMSPMEVRTEVLRFYNKYNRAKLKNVDMIMKAYEGRGEELLEQLREKYENNNENSSRNANTINSSSNDDNNNNTAKWLNKETKSDFLAPSSNSSEISPAEEVIPVQLTAEQQQAEMDRRITLLQFVLTFYSHYNAKNILKVDQIVDLYLGREQELLQSLQQKYDLTEPLDLDWQPASLAPVPVRTPTSPPQDAVAGGSSSSVEERMKQKQRELSCDTAARAKAAALPDPSPVSLSPMAPSRDIVKGNDDGMGIRMERDFVPSRTLIDSKPKSIFGKMFKSKSNKSKEFFVAGEETKQDASFGYFKRRASSSSGQAVIVHL